MALGYTITAILKRTSRMFFDDEVTVKIDKLEKLPQKYMQVQGKDRARVAEVASKLGLDDSYVPHSYIEQIQLENLIAETIPLPDDLQSKLSGRIDEHEIFQIHTNSTRDAVAYGDEDTPRKDDRTPDSGHGSEDRGYSRLSKRIDDLSDSFGLLQAKVGRNKEFEAALQALRGKDCDVSAEAAEIRVLTFTKYVAELERLPKACITDLFQGRYAHSIIVGVGLMVFQQLAGINAIIFYASEIFQAAGFSSGHAASVAVASLQGVVLEAHKHSGNMAVKESVHVRLNVSGSAMECPGDVAGVLVHLEHLVGMDEVETINRSVVRIKV